MTSLPVANPPVVYSRQPIATMEKLKRNKKVLTGLGIAETVIGSLSIVISCIAVGYTHDPGNFPYYSYNSYNYGYGYYYSPYSRFNIGEGIWCGLWILVSGALGIASGRKRPTICLINCHMGFSIVGAIFAVVLLSMGIFTAVNNRYPMSIGLEITMAIGGFAALILCILSAIFCCLTISSAGLQNGCGTCCTDEGSVPLGGGQVKYVVQSPQSYQQGIVQTYPTVMTGQQVAYPGNVVTVMQPSVAASYQPGLVGQQPVHFGQQPVHVSQQPVHVSQQPVHVSQQPAVQQSQKPLPKLPQVSESERKEQEAVESSADGAANEAYQNAPPSY